MRIRQAVLLAAGFGTRLAPLTDWWPKCLMPIRGRPLLDYWLWPLRESGVDNVFVNVHAHAEAVDAYLRRPWLSGWVTPVGEDELLGTAGTLRSLAARVGNHPVLIAHADNLVGCDLSAFLVAHRNRHRATALTMMTFDSSKPTSCGIVSTNTDGIVLSLEEKPTSPCGSLANGAVYVFEREVFDYIVDNPEVTDISTEVLPHFMGRIQTWHNRGVLRDIGSREQLELAQSDSVPIGPVPIDSWQEWFEASTQAKVISEYLANDPRQDFSA